MVKSIIRKIMCDSDVGDPPWKRETAACVVLGIGVIVTLPTMWNWVVSLFH